MSLTDDVEFVAFDVETTGLSPAFDRIVEIGAVRFRADGMEAERITQLIDPCCRIPERVVQVHGITNEMVRGRPTIGEVIPEFLRFLGNRETILLAHNASFDVAFLSAAFTQCATMPPENRVLDTLALSRWRLPGLRNHRLETVARHLRIDNTTKHRALADASVVHSLFLKLLSQRPVIRRMGGVFRRIAPLYFEQTAPIGVPPGCEVLVDAIQNGRSLAIVYCGGSNGRHPRMITPTRLAENRGRYYLTARCHIDDMEKHFRVDRIVEIQALV